MLRPSILLACLALFPAARGLAQSTTRVSVNNAGVQGSSGSTNPSISAFGRFVAFDSLASNLVSNDTNGGFDIFVRDIQAGTTSRVSVDSAGLQANSDSYEPAISADGRYVAFSSSANNLVLGDTNGWFDIFVHDRQTGATLRASVDSAGVQGDFASYAPAISADGRFVAFQSDATNLVIGDTNAATDIFVHDLQTGATTRVSVSSTGLESNGISTSPSISADGRYVAFASTAGNLVPGDSNGTWDCFVHDRQTGITTLVSVNSAGQPVIGASFDPFLSADGRYVSFDSDDDSLVVGDTNLRRDVFVHDNQTGSTTRVSVDSAGNQGSADSGSPSISANGRFVFFVSAAGNLVSGDSNAASDVFVHDRQTGSTVRVSVDSAGSESNGNSPAPVSISTDGRYVAFESFATNLVSNDTNAVPDVFVRDRGQLSAFTAFCFGDGLGSACPCANYGSPGHGCENSAGTGGALLSGAGVASLSADGVQFTASGELPTALCIFLQGDQVIAPASFGDGLRCAGGVLRRLYMKNASGGTSRAPAAGDATISAQSAALGDPLALGAVRIYQVYFRDANLGFCPAGFNVTNAISIAWGS